MRILTRYLLRVHTGPFLFALTLFTSLLLVNAVARRFQDLAGKGLSPAVIGEVFYLSIPHILALTLPMAVLVAVLYSFSQLTAENEVTALKASGVNLSRLLIPLVIASMFLAGGMVWFNDTVLPEANHRLKNLLLDISRKSPTLQLKEQVINEIQTGDYRTRYFLQASQIDPARNRLRDVVIYDLSVPGRSRTIYADSGRMAFNAAQTDLFFTLYDGTVRESSDQEPQSFQRLDFKEQLLRLRGVGNQLQRTGDEGYRGDREMSIAMLKREIAERERDLRQVAIDRAKPLDTRTRSLAADSQRQRIQNEMLDNRERFLRDQINSLEVEVQKKYSIPFACIVFVLIGAPIAVRFPRGGVGMVIAVSLTVFSVYYIGLRFGEGLGDKGLVPAFWGMWITNVIAFALGLWGISRVGKEASTARGGGWDDLWNSIREAPRRLVPWKART